MGSDSEITAYTSGLFDGEGCVIITKHPSPYNGTTRYYYGLEVNVGNTDKRVIDFLKVTYGGDVQPVKQKDNHHKAAWIWRLSGKNAQEFLSTIQPYTIVKSERIKVALEFRALGLYPGYRFYPGHITLPDGIEAKRDTLYWTMRELNKKGVH